MFFEMLAYSANCENEKHLGLRCFGGIAMENFASGAATPMGGCLRLAPHANPGGRLARHAQNYYCRFISAAVFSK